MIASRMNPHTDRRASNPVCPPRRSFVAGDARRRGPACADQQQPTIAFGAALPTPARFAGVDNTVDFNVIVVA
ncbi:MAG TPA: hypothetical protein PKO45_05710 [Rubrivivax sp.]|nr:hypothetical protein [Rubrivivax sp.]